MKNSSNSKLWFLSTLTTILVAIGLCLALNYWVDPLLQFRFDPDKPPYMKGTNRHLNPGLIKHADFDTLVIGTSMAQNFRPNELEDVFGGKAINLAMSGSSSWEQTTYLDLALESGKVKTVLWCIDLFMLSDEVTQGPDNFLSYLYTKDPSLNDRLSYLLNPYTTKRSLKSLTLRDKKNHQRFFDYKQITHIAWKLQYGKKQLLASIAEDRLYSFAGETYAQETLKAHFTDHIKPILNKYDNIRFVLFYPPYSALFWKDLSNKDRLTPTLAYKMWLSKQLLSHRNVELYDFQANNGINLNLENYTDLLHYSPNIDRQILHYIADKQYQVSQPGKVNAQIIEQLSELDASEFGL